MITLSSPTIVRFINGIFGRDYPTDSKITYNWTENVDDNLKKTIADTIITVNESDSFHLEAQMYVDDDSILLRMFDYSYSQARRNAKDYYDENGKRCGIILTFPTQVVIYLDSAQSVPDEYVIKLIFGKEDEYTYSVPTIKFQEESLNDIISRNMIILLPFKLLKVRAKFKSAYDNYTANSDNAINDLSTVISELREVFENDIISTIEESFRSGNISRSDMNLLLSLTAKLFDYLYSRYSSIKEVDVMLHDESLDLEIDKIYDAYEALENKLTKAENLIAEKEEQIAEKDETINKLQAEFDAYKASHP